MGIFDKIPGLNRVFGANDGGGGGGALPTTVPDVAASVPVNPEAAVDPQASQPEVASPTLNPSGVEGSGPNSTVSPDLGSDVETPTASTREIRVTDGFSSPEEAVVNTSLSTETEESTPKVEAPESVTPTSPTASETDT